jgi:hypothetical protein
MERYCSTGQRPQRAVALTEKKRRKFDTLIKKVDAEVFLVSSLTSRPNPVITKESVFAEHCIILFCSVSAVRHKMYSCLATWKYLKGLEMA